MRKFPFVNEQVYHICNRGVNKQKIFFSSSDFSHFLEVALHYKFRADKFSYAARGKESRSILSDPGSEQYISPKVDVLAYCLMPNHFHLLLKQNEEGGITWYLQHLINSYVHYVNTKHERIGPLFQGRFRAILMTSDEQLLHVVRYIHLNPVVAKMIESPNTYIWSSHKDYLSDNENPLIDRGFILRFFSDALEFQKFVSNHIEYARSLEEIKHSII